MSNKLKWAWLVVGFGLCASSASAAIPDASGVFHGCYNILTGATRLVDGTTCNLLERHVTWQQTGPQGEPGTQGVPGPQGPQGPSGDSKVLLGYEGFSFTAPEGHPQGKTIWFEDSTFTPTGPGKCVVTVSAFVDSNPGLYYMSIVYDNHQGSSVHSSVNQTGFSGDFGRSSATVTAGVPFDVGPPLQDHVRFGIYILAWQDSFDPGSGGEGTATWVCKYD